MGRAGGVVGAAIASGRVDDATLPGPLEPTASSSGQVSASTVFFAYRRSCCISESHGKPLLQTQEAASWPLDAEGRVLIKCLRFSELRHFLTTIGIRSDRAGHVWRWIYKHRINSWDDAQVRALHSPFGSPAEVCALRYVIKTTLRAAGYVLRARARHP